MYFSGVDVPADLIDAHASGNLVIFVGAGASMAPPSSLPGFKDLVRDIRDASNLASFITDDHLNELPLDEILGKINDQHEVDVHRQIKGIISKQSSRPNLLHAAIVNLASATTVRLVTTNYDPHLSTLLGELTVPEYLAPALPMGDDFTGIVYIHGRVDQECRRLIATDEDFGKAYLNDAWAARFLDRMFAKYPVLFIGYSHNDTIMKYLARGLGGRAEKRYAITSDDETSFWRHLGITPLHSPHSDHPDVLNAWASRSSEGLLDSRSRIKNLVAEQDPSPVPEATSYLEAVLGNKHTVRFFCEYARGKSWLQWANSRPEFATLFRPSPDVDADVTSQLASWFADNYVTDNELSDTALQIVVNAEGPPGDDLLFTIARQLSRYETPLSERMRRWILLVISRENQHITSLLGSLLDESSLREDPTTTLFLFDYLSEPRTLPVRSYSELVGISFEPKIRDDNGVLRDIWRMAFQPFINEYASRLIDIVERHIRKADLQLTIAGDSDRRRPSIWRASIAADDLYLSTPLGFLVDVARECMESLLAGSTSEGENRLQAWAASEVTLLHRLTVHTWTIRPDKTNSERLDWLLTTGWLHSNDLRHETTRLILESIRSAHLGLVTALIAEIRHHCEDDEYAPRRAYALLKSIDEIVNRHIVKEALKVIVAAHPGLVDRPEAAPNKESAWSTAPPTDKYELVKRLTEELESTVAALIACEANTSSWEEQQQWDQLASAITSVIQEWPEVGFTLLDTAGPEHPAIDQAVVRGWGMAQPSNELVPRILDRLSELEIQPILGYITAMLGGLGFSGSNSVQWAKYSESENLARKCWELIAPTAVSNLQSDDDYALMAMNHTAGHLVEFWVERTGHLWRAAPDAWNGIPPEIAEYFKEMISADNSRSEAAQIMFSRYLYFFHQADTEWCTHHLFPLLSWNNESHARKIWSGFLSHGGWTNQLLTDGLLGMLISTVNHRDQLRERERDNLSGLLAKLAVAAEIDPRSWLNDLITAGSAANNVAWTRAISFQLASLERVAVETQWQRWMHVYMSERVSGIPRNLALAEASALAHWALFLSESMADAIDLILQVETAGLGLHDLFFHRLNDDHVEREPEKIAQLVLHLLKSTATPFYRAHDLKHNHEKLRSAGAPADTLRQFREAAMRLGVDLE